MVGPGGVGKSSLLSGLMNQQLLQAESTILADTKTVKPQFWAKAGESADSYWAEVTYQDEIKELAALFQLVLARFNPSEIVAVGEFNPKDTNQSSNHQSWVCVPHQGQRSSRYTQTGRSAFCKHTSLIIRSVDTCVGLWWPACLP